MKKERNPSAASNGTRRRVRSVSSGHKTRKANSSRTPTLKLVATAEPAAPGEYLKKETAVETEVEQTASLCLYSLWRFGYLIF